MNDEKNVKVPVEETDICYTISIPKLKGTALDNLKLIIKSKENVIKKALGVTALPIEEVEDTLSFSGLPPYATQEEIHACMVLITKIAELAKKLRRVNNKKQYNDETNAFEKYLFRCFLIRIGMSGIAYK